MTFYVFIFLFILNSCASWFSNEKPVQSADGISFDSPGKNWKEIPSDKKFADVLLENEQSGSLIAVHSLCKQYENVQLHTLSNYLLAGMNKPEIILREIIKVDEREALKTRAKGLIDGVQVETLDVVYRKNDCLYDLTLNSNSKLIDSEIQDFSKIEKSFKGGKPHETR